MSEKLTQETREIMDGRFGCDSLIALATMEGNTPWVRTVNAYYENGCFYVFTHALSNKMRQIEENPSVAVCGDWFSGHGTSENLGHIRDEKNEEIAGKMRAVFCEWYDNGHTDEEDPNSCILCIRLTDGILYSHGTRYDIDFTE